MNVNNGILVIDSDDTIRDLLGEFFGSQGARVYLCENINDALPILAEHRPPVALIDIGPGYSCAPDDIERLRLADPDLKIILLSGNPSVQSVIDALRMRVFDFIVKPFCLKDLREIVDRAMMWDARQAIEDVRRRRIVMLEEFLREHGLTPPNDSVPHSGAIVGRTPAMAAAQSGPDRRKETGEET